ncbi:NmrA family NAD(P)-binding protein [Nocardia uniformis]|uniref:NmrA family NAD(P)-binding protein n=1 Tax=Nocardia uniformis TaxID=53432 RepID=A0A849C8S9_9NOCA|nr:NmrA family NAD(P)-binding protein [Nocardia uniformis]NNH72695.1 NmrA family NAD(P)-binding protein [Nocardia uniformis]
MSTGTELILITGATGKQGGATARRLLAAGTPVRALVRDPEAPAALELAAAGAELAVGDFDSPDTIDAAVAGVRAVMGVPPASYGPEGWDSDLEARRGEYLVEAARRAGIEQFVFTGIASFAQEGRWGAEGKRRIEDAVTASGMRWTVLRPVRFMENYLLRGLAVDGIRDGVHRHLFPADRPIQVIAVDDVAAFAQLAFADPDRFHGRTLELAGDARTMPDAARAISQATGIEVRFEEFTEGEAAAMGPEVVAVWRQSRAGAGWRADIPALREIHPALRTFDTWLAETGAAQLKALLT